MKKQEQAKKTLSYCILCICCLIAVFPFFWMITCAVRDPNALFSIPPRLFSAQNSLDNFVYVLTKTRIPRNLLNSLIISMSATGMCLVVSLPAGYALARFNFKRKNMVSSGVMLFKLLPQTAALIPLYGLMNTTHLRDTHFGLAFVDLFMMVPFAIWMSRGYFVTIPAAVEEAALIDGCNKPQALVKVVLPMISSGLFAVGLYAFMLSWEEFIFAYTFSASNAKPISVGIALFLGEAANLWGAVMASAVLMSLPILIAFFFIQDAFIRGMVGGAVKE